MGKYQLWTDGSARAHTGKGGSWAYVIVKGEDAIAKGVGAETETTNNRMELKSVIEGLKRFDPLNAEVEVVSDSAYVINCFKQKWFVSWRANNWRNSEGREVKNRDLWEELLAVVETFTHPIKWTHVRGHVGHKWNEICDQMCSDVYK